MIFRVAEGQNDDFLGPADDFSHVRKKSRFWHRLWIEKVITSDQRDSTKRAKCSKRTRVTLAKSIFFDAIFIIILSLV